MYPEISKRFLSCGQTKWWFRGLNYWHELSDEQEQSRHRPVFWEEWVEFLPIIGAAILLERLGATTVAIFASWVLMLPLSIAAVFLERRRIKKCAQELAPLNAVTREFKGAYQQAYCKSSTAFSLGVSGTICLYSIRLLISTVVVWCVLLQGASFLDPTYEYSTGVMSIVLVVTLLTVFFACLDWITRRSPL